VGRGVRRSATAKAEDTIRRVAARRSGRTVADIAAGAGVSKATVSRATSPHGPFPSHRNRQEPASCWARRRRRGETVASIARDVGVTTGRVAAATRLYGPFPRGRLTDPSTAAHWAEERRRRVPAAEIARRCQVPISRVYDATRTLGPFPSPLQGAAGTVSLRGISRMSGVSLPALTLRLRRGTLPDPAGHGPRGWPYWNIDDIQDWLAASTLPACPLCRARVQRLDSHLLLSHTTAPAHPNHVGLP